MGIASIRAGGDERARGVAFGLSAYVLWGIFPLYWPLLARAGALEILAHRVVESLLFLALVNVVRHSWPDVLRILRTRRTSLLLLAAAVLVTANWGVFIWAVNAGYVVETSLGYFINPLVSMLLGVIAFRERMRPTQWTAFGIATAAVVFLTIEAGRLPWIALVLAGSFATYGLMKKLANVEAIASLTVETAFVAPLFLGYLVWLEVQGRSTFLHAGAGHTALMLTTGIVTAVPLLLFGAAAIRIPLVTLGVLQYVGPTLQFLIGVYILREPMNLTRLIGFCIVWVALVIFTADAYRQSRLRRAEALTVEEPV